MELALLGAGVISSVLLYKHGKKKGQEQGYTLGYDHGIFKAQEFAEILAKQRTINEKLVPGHKPTKARFHKHGKDVAWVG